MKFKHFIWFIVLFLSCKIVYANDIKSITMDIFIDNYGNANITEVWKADLDNGTEGYKPYYNLGNSTIEDYQVSLGSKPFQTLSYWNVDASFNEKSYKAGINAVDDGYELCFGISEYGNNTYTLKYTITNFVSRLEDADMVYWQLIPYDLSDKPEQVYIKIHSDFAYSDDLPVWGYGYGDDDNEGYAYVADGIIEMSKKGALDSDEYMTVLIKFPKDTFELSNTLEHNFTYYLNMAKNGSYNYHDKISFAEVIGYIFAFILDFLPFIIVVLVSVFAVKNSNNYGTKNLKFNKNIRSVKDAPYFRDIPLNKDVFKAYWVACQFHLVKNKTDFLGAILLKWLKNGNIENIKDESKNKKLKLISSNNLTPLEVELFDMMSSASGDGILEKNEFTKWCKNHYSKILKWFNKVIDDTTMNFVNAGLIREEKKTFSATYYVDDKMKDYGLEMAGLKNFLNDFSNIKNREAIEVKIWDEYLIYAQIFGIAKKVAEEFKKLYPDVITDDYYDDIIFIHMISYEGVHAASVAQSRAESYSAGGGGFSSSGGGGGSFGGGGGGGGFR